MVGIEGLNVSTAIVLGPPFGIPSLYVISPYGFLMMFCAVYSKDSLPPFV